MKKLKKGNSCHDVLTHISLPYNLHKVVGEGVFIVYHAALHVSTDGYASMI